MPDTASAARTARVLAEHFGSQPFTSRMAHGVVSPRALRTAVGRGTVRRIRRGSYALRLAEDRAHADLAHYRQRIAAVLASRPAAVAVEESALALHGLSLPYFGAAWDLQPVRIVGHRGARVHTDQLQVRKRSLPAADCTMTPFGLATTPVRSAIDLARRLDVGHALIVADEACAAALLREVVPAHQRPPGSRELLAGRHNQARDLILRAVVPRAPGVRRVRQIGQWVDPAAESPGESYSRAGLLAAGVPRPAVGMRVTGAEGQTYYADLAWPDRGVIGEVDGFGKYRGDSWGSFLHEKEREDALRAAGWLVVRWTVAQFLRNPAAVVARVQRALLVAGSQASRRFPP